MNHHAEIIMQVAALQQHDLRPEVAKRILETAAVQPGETVVDAGAGRGALTAGLLAAGAVVHALEADPQRIAHLQQAFAAQLASGQLHVWPGDALMWKAKLPAGWRVVANPPFNLTAKLLNRWLVKETEPPAAFDLVLQREVALKLTPVPGSMTRTAVLVSLTGRASLRVPLTREATSPPSRVDLALWCFRRKEDAVSHAELQAVDKLLHKGFAGAHTVLDAVRGLATALQVRRQAAENGWKPNDHPRRLTPAAWLAFAKHLVMCQKL